MWCCTELNNYGRANRLVLFKSAFSKDDMTFLCNYIMPKVFFLVILSAKNFTQEAHQILACILVGFLLKLYNFYRNTHLKDDNPGIGDVIKVDGTFVRVAASSVTPCVVLVPVDTQPCYTDAAIGQRFGAQTE